MDYIRNFDIRLDKDVYYAGEVLAGTVYLETLENLKIRGIRLVLRGKAHAEWKIMKSGERRTVKDDQYLLDEKVLLWGKDKYDDDGFSVPILPRGAHQLPFHINLPQSSLPCSFESKCGTIRYYVKVIIDVPYASPPQGIKYFTIIGPHIDCMDDKYLTPMVGYDKKTVCCLCCQRGPLALHITLDRTAYVSGENVRLRAQIDNQSDQTVAVRVKLMQYVEYFIDKGVLGVNKHHSDCVLEQTSPRVAAFSGGKYDSTLEQPILLPCLPPTLIGCCRLVQIYYVLKVSLDSDRNTDELVMEFPFTVATVPFRIPTSKAPPQIEYDFCASHVEGGKYISPEFQVGQVYDGTQIDEDNIVLYRPVYCRVPQAVIPRSTDQAAVGEIVEGQPRSRHPTDPRADPLSADALIDTTIKPIDEIPGTSPGRRESRKPSQISLSRSPHASARDVTFISDSSDHHTKYVSDGYDLVEVVRSKRSSAGVMKDNGGGRRKITVDLHSFLFEEEDKDVVQKSLVNDNIES